MSLFGRFCSDLDDLLQHRPPGRLGVAVSGGGDSMALMHLLQRWSDDAGSLVHVATVDHGLRPEAAREAEFVAEAARGLGMRHETLCWKGWDGSGNLQSRARAARYELLADWARRNDLDAVALGHTADDVAETFLMRLARGSGVDGLAAMQGLTRRNGMDWLRPLLRARRGDLRTYLSGNDIGWIDDPSNDDPRFDRIKMRQALDGLAELGLTRDRLTGTADMMAEARRALSWAAQTLAQDTVTQIQGDLVIDLSCCANAPRETRLRLISAGLCWVAAAVYRPRLSQLEDALDAIARGEARQLHGCHMLPEHAGLRICREFGAVRDASCAVGETWDGRWQLIGPDVAGAETRALGAGLTQCGDWREAGLPRISLEASPAIWWGETLIAAPLAGFSQGYSAHLVPERADFTQFLGVH